MADLDVLHRRLLRIVEQRRPDIDPGRRVEIVDAVVDGLKGAADLTVFWSTLYEYMPPVKEVA